MADISGAAKPFDAVVIVGSQGSLHSVQRVLGSLTKSFATAIIFDHHRGEDHGAIARMLSRGCSLQIRPAKSGARLDPATVSLAPHDQQLTLGDDGLMRLSASAAGVGHRSANGLLSSAARVLGPRMIAVVLSGRLEGGARGVREVKRGGGRVIVEDPTSAVAPAMPNAALATGCVDFALRPEAIAHALVAMCEVAGASDLFRVRMNASLAS